MAATALSCSQHVCVFDCVCECECVCVCVCVGISSGCVSESLLQEWACARGFGVRAFGREAAKLHHVFWTAIVPEAKQDDAN